MDVASNGREDEMFDDWCSSPFFGENGDVVAMDSANYAYGAMYLPRVSARQRIEDALNKKYPDDCNADDDDDDERLNPGTW